MCHTLYGYNRFYEGNLLRSKFFDNLIEVKQNTINRDELDEIIKTYTIVAEEVKELKVTLIILFKDNKIEVLEAIPGEVITREQTSLKRFL